MTIKVINCLIYLVFENDNEILKKRKNKCKDIGFFAFIDYIFCLQYQMKKIEKYYGNSIVDSFMASVHCLRISIISFLVFGVFIVLSFLNNYVKSPCKTPFLCYGYLSFQRKPIYLVVIYVLCLITFLTFLFIYIVSMMVNYYLMGSQKQPEDSKLYTSFSFITPTLKIFNEEDKKNGLDFIANTFQEFDNCLKKDEDDVFKDYLLNIIILIGGLILICANSVFSCCIFYLFNYILTEDYFIVRLLHNISLT